MTDIPRTVPAIRFTPFTEEWQQKKLKELTKCGFSNGVFNDPAKAGIGYRLINVKDMYTGHYIHIDRLSLINLDEKEFIRNKVEYGDVFFTRSSLVKEGIAHSNVNLSDHQKLTFDGHLIRMQPCKETTVPQFLSVLFKTDPARQQFIAAGKTTTMTTIGQSEISAVEVFLPKPEEQTKIGDYFQQLDTLITQHQQKHDKLLNLKKSLLEKMFPKQGESVPAIRFKGFANNWEERLLGDEMQIASVKRIHQSDWTSSGIRFLRARDIVSAYKNEDLSEYLYISEEKYHEYSLLSGKVFQGDLLVTGVGTIGVPMLIKDNNPVYFKDGNIIWFKNRNIICPSFLYYSFIHTKIQDYIKSSAGIGTVGTYTIESGKKTPILLSSTEEQGAIGGLFQKVDKLLELHQQQLTKLKNLKKAHLAKMFV